MKLGYIIHYVSDVVKTMTFYESAFGLERKMLHESKEYGEMKTGDTVLAFASNAMADHNGFEIYPNTPQEKPAGIEIAFVTEDVEAAHKKACDAGAVSVKQPEEKPWGQTVSYVRDINGCLVELCTKI